MASNQFFTEFPVTSKLGRQELGTYVVNWISGIEASQLNIKEAREALISLDSFKISVDGGECLSHVSIDNRDGPLFGFQYDIPDDNGRVWRTEAVVSVRANERVLCLRVSCVRGDFSAVIATPRRPVLLKQILEDAIGGFDGELLVSDSAHFLSEEEIEKGKTVVLGQASFSLPVVYVSSFTSGELPVDVERLAFELGGLAHVLVEPSRSFSFLLKDETEGRNPYGGAIGIGFPGRPIDVRVLPTSDRRNQFKSIVNLVRETFVGRTATRGADWSELQQAAYQSARIRLVAANEKGAPDSGVEDWIDSFEGEIREKNETIDSLRAENSRLRARLAAGMSESALGQKISQLRGEVGELYEGEILDRIRNAVASAANANFSIHPRDRAVMDALLPMLQVSGLSGLLLDQLKLASDPKKTDDALKQVLLPLGFTRGEQGEHIKYSPPKGLSGIESISVAKTPSDHRSGDNAIRDTRKALSLHFVAETSEPSKS